MSCSAKEWLEITPEGKSDPIFQFDQDPDKNEKVLANLPGMFLALSRDRAKLGRATVLAWHADPACGTNIGQHRLASQ